MNLLIVHILHIIIYRVLHISIQSICHLCVCLFFYKYMYTKEQMQTNNIHSFFTVNNDSLMFVSAVDLISVQIGQEHVSGKIFSP